MSELFFGCLYVLFGVLLGVFASKVYYGTKIAGYEKQLDQSRRAILMKDEFIAHLQTRGEFVERPAEAIVEEDEPSAFDERDRYKGIIAIQDEIDRDENAEENDERESIQTF